MKAFGFNDMSKYNRLTVLNLIKHHGQISRADLVKLTDLTGPSVSRIIVDLMEEGLVKETGIGESSGGRKPILLEFNVQARTVLGLDIRPERVSGEVYDLAAQSISRREIEFCESLELEKKLEIIAGLAGELCREAAAIAPVIGLGVAVPGVVDSANGIVRYSVPMRWRKVDLRRILEEACHVPVFVDNISRCVAIGEKWFGNGQSQSDFIYLYVGEGIGAGIVANGHLYHGSKYSAAEIGHTTVEINGLSCRCGNKGCLELYTSVNALWSRMDRALGQEIKTKDELWTYLAQDSPQSWQAVEDTLAYLGAGVANLINTFNPETIIIGGWPLKAGPRALQSLERIVSARAMEGLTDGIALSFSKLDEDGPLVGASTLVLESFLNPSFPDLSKTAAESRF